MQGNRRGAIATMQLLVGNNPFNPNYRYRLANLLIAENELDLAFEQAKWLIRNNQSSRRFNALMERIERKKNQQNAGRF